jgi:outer membrane protein
VSNLKSFRLSAPLGIGLLAVLVFGVVPPSVDAQTTRAYSSGAASDIDTGSLDQVSLDEAIRLAHEYNPSYRVQESQGDAAEWRVREAWGSLIPSASASQSFGYTASGDRLFEGVVVATEPAVYSSGYNVGLSTSLNGAALLRPSVVRDQNAATEAQIDGASAGLVDEVTQTYLSVLEAEEQLRQARSELERTRSYVRQAEAQVEVGAATPLDIRRAELQEGQAEVQLLQAENSVYTTRLSLGRILGVPITQTTELTTRFELFEPVLDSQELLSMALDRNPVLRASRSQASAAQTQTRMTRAQYFPSLSISANWRGSVNETADVGPLINNRLGQLQNQYESCLQDNRVRELLSDPPRDCSQYDPSIPAVEAEAREQVRSANRGFPFDYRPQPLSLSVGVSIPIFTGFSRQLQMEEARISETNAQRQVRAEELRLQAEVESAVRAVETAHRMVALQVRIRDTAAEELRLAQERFRLGLASSIEVVDAQANLSQAEQDEISAIYSFHQSFAGLEVLVGGSLRE